MSADPLDLATLAELQRVILSRKGAAPETSYTAKLFADGTLKCAKKLGEEAVEMALAAIGEDDAHLAAEGADVLYHLIVLLAARGLTLADVTAVLKSRLGTGGLAEKASRKQP